MSNPIVIREFSTMPQLATDGWDPNACDASDYTEPRAAALYDALGVSPRDAEYALARHADGRLALIGLTVEGHKWAAEATEGYFYDRAPCNGDRVRRPATLVGGVWFTPSGTGGGSVRVPSDVQIHAYTEEERADRARRDALNDAAVEGARVPSC